MAQMIIIFLALFLSFVFSGSEMGLYSVNRLRLRSRAEINWPGAGALRELAADPHGAINTILIGNNLAHYIATVCFAALLTGWGIERNTDLYSTVILAPFLVVFTEIMPKVLFLRRPDVLMYKLSSGLRLTQILCRPLLRLLDALNSLLCLLTGRQPSELGYRFTPEKLRSLLSEGAAAGLVSQYQHRMVENVLRVKDIPLREALIPLNEVVAAPDSASRSDILRIFRENEYSRLPVFSGSPANITGMVNLIDMLVEEPGEDISHLVREPEYVNTDDSVSHALYALQRSGGQMAVVLDREGRAAGICTVKDLVEEIVGEIYEW